MDVEIEFTDSEFSLVVCTIKQHQVDNERYRVWLQISKQTVTQAKRLKEYFLIDNNNGILIPDSIRDRILQWYHLIQTHLDEEIGTNNTFFLYEMIGDSNLI